MDTPDSAAPAGRGVGPSLFAQLIRDRSLRLAGGLAIAVDVTWRHIGEQERFGVGLRGSKGTAGINPLHVWKELNGVTHDVSPTGSLSRENAFTASFRAEWAHFLAAISSGVDTPPIAEQITLLKVMEAIYKSAADGKDVAL